MLNVPNSLVQRNSQLKHESEIVDAPTSASYSFAMKRRLESIELSVLSYPIRRCLKILC